MAPPLSLPLAIIYSEEYKKHFMFLSHPESPKRLDPLLEGIKSAQENLKQQIEVLPPLEIEENVICLVHTQKLLDTIKTISERGGGVLEYENVLNEYTFEVAKLAVGGAIQAVSMVHEGKAQKSFALVRPPGHHASAKNAGGFCFFNNIAIATEWLMTTKSYSRVAIIDIDNHFGNGTSDIFYERKDVLFYSIHLHPHYSYPGRGYIEEVGKKEGAGYNINVPIIPRTSGNDWLYLFQKTLAVVEAFQPEFILVSVGFDGLEGDVLGGLELNPEIYQEAAYIISSLAEKVCQGKVVCVLEGGYNLELLPLTMKLFIQGLLGEKSSIEVKQDLVIVPTYTTLLRFSEVITNYWKIKFER